MENGEVSAEVHFAQKLASNEKKIRDRAIKRLQKYLTVRSRVGAGLSDDDLLKIWKGLFYCMWMQDKPLIQEELSKRITNLLNCFSTTKDALRFTKVFLQTQAREWTGIDRLRLDKFMMMIRDLLQETFRLMSRDEWEMQSCRSFAKSISECVMQPNESQLPDGLKLHLADMFVDEIRKVSLKQMTSKKMVVLLRPFIDFVLHSNKIELVKRVMSDVIYKTVNIMSLGKEEVSAGKEKEAKADSDEEDGSESGEEPMEDDGDRDKSGKEGAKMFKFDLGLLLLVLFKLAGRQNVHAPNRKLIYKLIKKHSEKYNSAINSMESSSDPNSMETTSIATDPDLTTETITDADLQLLLDDGQVTDQQQTDKKHKKKRRKKKNKEGANLEVTISSESASLSDAGSEKSKQKKKRKHSNDENNSGTSENVGFSKGDNKDVTHSNDNRTSSSDRDGNVLRTKSPHSGLNHINSSHSTADKEGKHVEKKRKHKERQLSTESLNSSSITSDESSSPPAKKPKLTQKNDIDINSADHVQTKDKKSKKKKKHVNETEISCEDSSSSLDDSILYEMDKTPPAVANKNDNARSRCRSASPPKSGPVSSPVELVVYKQSSSTRLHSCPTTSPSELPANKSSPTSSPSRGKRAIIGGDLKVATEMVPEITEELSGSEETPQHVTTVASIFSRKNKKGGHSRSPSPQKHSKKAGSESATHFGNLYSAIAGPGSVVSKAFSMMTHSGDDSQDNGTETCKKGCKTPELTPGSKKKVVFNLRKNKASKVQDFLKSVAQQPEAPFMPSKSPSASILKSPAPSPGVSETSMDLDTDSSSMSLSHGKGKKKSKGKRSSEPTSPAYKASPGKGKKRQSTSPARPVSTSPSPVKCKSNKCKIKSRALLKN